MVVTRDTEAEATVRLGGRPTVLTLVKIPTPSARSAMKHMVLPSAHQTEIFKTIVGAIPVDVMDVVSVRDGPIGCLPKQAMLKSISRLSPHAYVSIRRAPSPFRMIGSFGMPEAGSANVAQTWPDQSSCDLRTADCGWLVTLDAWSRWAGCDPHQGTIVDNHSMNTTP